MIGSHFTSPFGFSSPKSRGFIHRSSAHPSRLGPNISVCFTPQFPNGLGGFSRCWLFGFPSQFSARVRRFFIELRGCSAILRFSSSVPTGWRSFSLIDLLSFLLYFILKVLNIARRTWIQHQSSFNLSSHAPHQISQFGTLCSSFYNPCLSYPRICTNHWDIVLHQLLFVWSQNRTSTRLNPHPPELF